MPITRWKGYLKGYVVHDSRLRSNAAPLPYPKWQLFHDAMFAVWMHFDDVATCAHWRPESYRAAQPPPRLCAGVDALDRRSATASTLVQIQISTTLCKRTLTSQIPARFIDAHFTLIHAASPHQNDYTSRSVSSNLVDSRRVGVEELMAAKCA